MSNPDVIKAFISAQAPGIGIISILFCMASFTITSPGSEIAGVPASVIRAIFSPFNNLLINKSFFIYLFMGD